MSRGIKEKKGDIDDFNKRTKAINGGDKIFSGSDDAVVCP